MGEPRRDNRLANLFAAQPAKGEKAGEGQPEDRDANPSPVASSLTTGRFSGRSNSQALPNLDFAPRKVISTE
jgi:hypothetical protein